MRYFTSRRLDTYTHGHTDSYTRVQTRELLLQKQTCCTITITCRSVPHYKMQSCEKFMNFHFESHWTDTFVNVAQMLYECCIYTQQHLDQHLFQVCILQHYCFTFSWQKYKYVTFMSSPWQSHECQITSVPIITVCVKIQKSGPKAPAPSPAFILPSYVKWYWFKKKCRSCWMWTPTWVRTKLRV